MQEEAFAREIVQHILSNTLVSLEDSDFLSNLFDGLLSSSISASR